MKKPEVPSNERERLKSLKSLGLLDGDKDPRLDKLVKLASEIAETPIALISLVDANRQWFMANHGLDAKETPRDISFCGHAINSDDLFEINDAAADERFSDNPLVTSDPNIKFYAGKPLKTNAGYNIGTLCVIDKKSKKLSDQQKIQLETIANEIIFYIEDKKRIEELKDEVNSKSAFVASMSHELRTPLTSVVGFADVLTDIIKQDEINREEIAKTVSILKSSSEHLVGLIGDILDFSKLEAKKFLVKNETFLLGKLLKQVYNTLNIQAEKYDVEFSIQQSMSTPEYIFGDITLIKQILINLGGNAIKFSNGESVKINVDLGEGDNLIAIDIIDTGVGMNEEEAAKVFRPFMQANQNIAKKFDGTGLGLSITKEITELLGGHIQLIKSEKGIGSHFKVELPFIEKLEEDFNAATNAENTINKNNSELLNNKKILIVDDVKENRFLIRHYLKGFNVDFKDAINGEEALRKFDRSFDYILLDMQLPDMNGLEVNEKLKAKLSPHQKVIAFTASSTNTGIEECLNQGFSSYLVKPFDTESIIESLKSSLH